LLEIAKATAASQSRLRVRNGAATVRERWISDLELAFERAVIYRAPGTALFGARLL
jgi:hypothetical protein